jgi:AcrR family transcriptional regulator
MKEKRRALRAQMTRDSLHEAAVKVITREGPEGITMDRVAREAGLAKGTLYLYFKTKEDLVESTVQAGMMPLAEQLHALLDGPLAPEEKLRRLPLVHLGYFEKHRDFYRILLYERDAAQARCRRRKATRYQVFLETLAGVIRQGIRSGVFRPMDADNVAAMWAEASIALIHRRLGAERPGSLKADAALMADVFLNGMKREKS